MTRILILILIIIVLGYLWYQWQARKSGEQERAAQRQLTARSDASRAPLPPLAGEPSSVDAVPRAAARAGGSGLLQEAADAAAELDLERATGEMERASAELAASRRQAEEAAARLRDQADEALTEVQAAAVLDGDASDSEVDIEVIEIEAPLIGERGARDDDIVARAIAAADRGGVPPGAVRGDGGRVCPPIYPIKGNEQSMLYHLPDNPTYQGTIPELCFSTVEAAQAAGYSEAKH